MRQLLIGPRLNKDGTTLGGSEVLFENWIKYCSDNEYEMVIVDANKYNYANLIVALVSIVCQIFRNASKCDVIFLHGSKNDYFAIAPIVALIAKMFNRPFFLKKFGGVFDEDFNKAPWWKRMGISWAMKRAAGLYWELKRLLPFGKRFNEQSKWIPNTREKTSYRCDVTKPFDKKKIVFLSHVRKEKGIDEILEAFRMLGPEYNIDIYGTLMGYKSEDLVGHYHGVIPPNEVPRILSEYQLLVLPSWNEGYPGIIIEAFGCGMPVLASYAGGIPEMIEDGVNGVLCEAHNPQAIVEAIHRIEQIDIEKISYNALKSFDTYDGDKVNKSIIADLEAACVK